MDAWFTTFAIVSSLLAASGVTLLLVGYIGTLPAAFQFGWRNWLPTLLIPVAGPIWFALKQRGPFTRPAVQLIAGVLLLGLAGAVVAHFGPYFAAKLVAEAKKAAADY